MDRGRLVLAVDLLERYAAKGRGVITCMAAGNDVIVLGTSKGWVIRHDFGVGDSSEYDLTVGRTGEQSIHRVFVDPGGLCISTVVGNGGSESFYMHAKRSKPRVLDRLKGLTVNAVAWNRQLITEASRREIIFGMDNGQLYEMAGDEKDKREKYINFLFKLSELLEAFTGLQAEYVLDMQKQLTLLVSQARMDQNGGINDEPVISTTSAEKLRQHLDDAIAGECPFCGELMSREITLPFILPEEAQEVTSWEIKPTLANLRSVSLRI